MKVLSLLVAVGCAALVESTKVKGLQHNNREEYAERRGLQEGCEMVRYSILMSGDDQIAPNTPIPGASGVADVVVSVTVPGFTGCDEDRKKKKEKKETKRKGKKSKSKKNKEYREEENREDEREYRVEDGIFTVCFERAKFSGIVPEFLRIREAPLNENGEVFVDFTDMLTGMFDFSLCQEITMAQALLLVSAKLQMEPWLDPTQN